LAYLLADIPRLRTNITDKRASSVSKFRSIIALGPMPPKSSFRRFNSFRSDKANKASKELKGKQNTDPQGGAVEPALGLAASSRTTVATTSATAGDVPQSAPSHVLAGIQPQSHEQVTTAVGPSASSPQQNTAGLVLAPPSTVHDPIESLAAILPEQLWDRAYDDLKTNESDLVKAYENSTMMHPVPSHSSSKPMKLKEQNQRLGGHRCENWPKPV